MKTQFFNSRGEVILSKWWRTQSAQAAFRRVAKAAQQRFKEIKTTSAARKAEAATLEKQRGLRNLRKVRRK